MSRFNYSSDGLRQKGSASPLADFPQSPVSGSKIQDAVVLNVSQLTNINNEQNQLNKKTEVKLLFLNITHLSPFSQFLLLSAATFGFYLVYGYIQVKETIS